MKKVTLLFIPIFSACLLQACHSNKNNDSDTEDTSNMAADTLKVATVPIDKEDVQFVSEIGSACLAEIKVGTLAKQQGQDKRIKNFGVMMVKDLSKGHQRLLNLAKAKKINLPDSLSTADQQEVADLAKKRGKDFDNAYLAKTKADHVKALEMFRIASKNSYDKDVKGFANHNLLTLQRHIDAIDAIKGSMK